MVIFQYQPKPIKVKCLTFTLCLIFILSANAFGQSKMAGTFERITSEVKNYRIDTSAAPDDKITRAIIKLRELKGGFNITGAMEFKLEEAAQKKELPDSTLALLKTQFATGNAGRWLQNAVIHVYRDHFSYRELKKMIRFYKSDAGRKLADEFPVVMLESLAAAEMIQGMFAPKK